MHLCIVGTGAAGWITCHWLARHPAVKKITIIGSPAIPTIGVGESTTMHFFRFLQELLPDREDFWRTLLEMDAAVKYGVSYEGWGPRKFLHAFVGSRSNNLYGYLLGRKPPGVDANRYMMPLSEEIYSNLFCPDPHVQAYSFHFDANRLIATFQRLAERYPQVVHIRQTVTDSEYNGGKVTRVWLDNQQAIEADYFISCIGQTAFNQRVFREEYQPFSDVLLTDKALFYPLPYRNKREQFHPYTVAKTMRHGWRWITPTWSRIGTGYVFSSRHISIEEAVDEFTDDLGDKSIKPNLVDFHPRKVRETFKENYCTLGMAAGFMEPLDAPGLNLLLHNLRQLEVFFLAPEEPVQRAQSVARMNRNSSDTFNFWAAFILHQYKTCPREDTQFWRDHRAVEFNYYSQVLDNLKQVKVGRASPAEPLQVDFMSQHRLADYEPYMFYHTSAGRDLTWPVSVNLPLQAQRRPEEIELFNHFDFFQELRRELAVLAED